MPASPTVARALAVAGATGPLAFVGAWLTAGSRAAGYSPVTDPISRLAAIGASTRPLMTTGLLVYAAGLAGYSARARPIGDARPALGWWGASAACAVATAAVAATPLDGPWGGTPHALAAGSGYAALALVPLSAAGRLHRAGRRRAATAAVATGSAVAACLVASVAGLPGTGAWQRAGLTLGDTWLVVTAIAAHRAKG